MTGRIYIYLQFSTFIYSLVASTKISHYDCIVTVGITDAVEPVKFSKVEWNSHYSPA